MTIPENSNPTYTPPSMPVYRRDSSLAIASLICGIAGWLFVPFLGAIAAIITGHLAKKEIRESNGMLDGDGMAIAGLVLGYTQIGLILLAVVCIMTFAFSMVSGGVSHLVGPSASLLKFMI